MALLPLCHSKPFNYSSNILIILIHFNFPSFSKDGGCIWVMADAVMSFDKKNQRLN